MAKCTEIDSKAIYLKEYQPVNHHENKIFLNLIHFYSSIKNIENRMAPKVNQLKATTKILTLA